MNFVRRQIDRVKFATVVGIGLVKALWVQYRYKDEIRSVAESQVECDECYPRHGLFCEKHEQELEELFEEVVE